MGIWKILAGRNRMKILVLYHCRSPRLEKGKKMQCGPIQAYRRDLYRSLEPFLAPTAVLYGSRVSILRVRMKLQDARNRALDADCRYEQIPYLEVRAVEIVRAFRLGMYSTSSACHIIQAQFVTFLGLQFH